VFIDLRYWEERVSRDAGRFRGIGIGVWVLVLICVRDRGGEKQVGSDRNGFWFAVVDLPVFVFV